MLLALVQFLVILSDAIVAVAATDFDTLHFSISAGGICPTRWNNRAPSPLQSPSSVLRESAIGSDCLELFVVLLGEGTLGSGV